MKKFLLILPIAFLAVACNNQVSVKQAPTLTTQPQASTQVSTETILRSQIDSYLKEKLNIAKGISDSNVIVNTEEQYARVSIFTNPGGYYFLAAAGKDQIVILAQGQEDPSCDLVQLNNIPKSVYHQCFDLKTNSTK